MSADEKPSVPIALLLEGINHTVTVEMKNGESYKGELKEAELNMNIQMSSVQHTARNGQKRKLEHIYLRGTNVKLIILPSFLKEAPIFKTVTNFKQKEDRKAATKAKASKQRSGRPAKKARTEAPPA